MTATAAPLRDGTYQPCNRRPSAVVNVTSSFRRRGRRRAGAPRGEVGQIDGEHHRLDDEKGERDSHGCSQNPAQRPRPTRVAAAGPARTPQPSAIAAEITTSVRSTHSGRLGHVRRTRRCGPLMTPEPTKTAVATNAIRAARDIEDSLPTSGPDQTSRGRIPETCLALRRAPRLVGASHRDRWESIDPRPGFAVLSSAAFT